MPKIIVTAYDWSKPGSFRVRQRLMRAGSQIKAATESDDAFAAFTAYMAVEDLIIPRLRTDDGSDLDAALDELSADDFDALIKAAQGIKDGDTTGDLLDPTTATPSSKAS